MIARVMSLEVSAQKISPNGSPRVGMQVKAGKDNIGQVWLGNSDVSITRGYPLDPGENIFLPMDNTDLLYAMADNAGDKLYLLLI